MTDRIEMRLAALGILLPSQAVPAGAYVPYVVAGDLVFISRQLPILGASELMMEVLGEVGRHARMAVGVAALPLGAAVEIDGVFQIV